MSVFLRRSLYCSCTRFATCRPFSLTSFLSRPAANTNTEAKPTRTRKKKQTADLEPVQPSRNLLIETKVQEYLDHIASVQEISLADLEREYKPSIRPDQAAPEYEEEYNKVVGRLVRSFSIAQLRNIVRSYELHVPAKCPKWDIAAIVVESRWKWPSLTNLKQERRNAETAYESFPLDAKQAFLILGKDGEDLLDLSSKYGIHVSFSAKPLALNVEGSRASLGELRQYLETFKKGMKEICFELPPARQVEPDILQRISRASGVFVENGREGKGMDGDDRAVSSAKRLTLRAAALKVSS
ncbi:hypothetical protein H0H92_001482 [Tricholoma furcatifolium]|nr:hypothetical protein H0H92_001482 [Tricholoma furcatifolium]